MESKFTVSEVLSIAWQALKSQIWILVGLFIGIFIISLVISLLLMPAMQSLTGQIIGQLITTIISLVFGLGYLKNLFQTLDWDEPQFSAYGQQAGKILTYFLASIICGVLVALGTILLIIPGIYLYLRLQFFMCFIVEEDAGIIDSLKRSWVITDGQILPLLLLLLAMIGISILGIILLGIGMFVALPLVMLMQCVVFRKLNSPVTNIEEA